VIRARQQAQINLRRARERQLAQANTPAQRAQAEALPTEVDDRVFADLDQRRRQMLEREARGDYDEWEELAYLWDEWRDEIIGSYEQMAG
tara:strand:- start:5364 stop:5633 length:270 start_codon:yes stop_codon:yes gene_type:complete